MMPGRAQGPEGRRFRDLPGEWIDRAASSTDCVLLETRRFDGDNYRSYLFTSPRTVLRASRPEDVHPLLETLEDHCRRGFFAAGYVSYEAGITGEDTGQVRRSGYPVAWFGIYERPEVFDHRTGAAASGPIPSGTAIDPRRIRLLAGLDEYRKAVRTIQEHIREGNTYQVNYTTAFEFPAGGGDPASLYALLRGRQRVAYGGLLNAGDVTVLTFSPELFFRLSGGRIAARPMKGTARRGRTLGEDDEQRAWLPSDAKNRSENIMIVDLIRNDLSRLCVPGSVETTELCTVETYETLLQMTSTVEGDVLPGTSLGEIFRALFPSGSVTGAPKIRSMQIISELEPRPRGIYTGAIGFVTPGRDAVFNVAIRTVVLRGGTATMGTGGGIVIDSDADEEYAECLLKGRFLTEGEGEFRLFETMLWDGTFPLLRFHLDRLRSSAAYFDFAYRPEEAEARLAQAAALLRRGERHRVRLLLDREGTMTVETTPLATSAGMQRIAAAPVHVSSADRFVYHKTTRRELLDSLYARAQEEGFADALLVNERGEVTECTRNNIFILRGETLVTPPVSCGLLPGVYRAYLLAGARVREETLTPADLAAADAVYLSNALHGLRPVEFIPGARLRQPLPQPEDRAEEQAAR